MSFESYTYWDDPQSIREYLDYTQSINAVATYLRVSPLHLIEALNVLLNPEASGYNNFGVLKKSGNVRQLVNPQIELVKIQDKIKNRLYNFDVSDFAHGGVRRKSNITNAKTHRKSDYFLKFDIENAYPSVTCEMVDQLFKKLFPAIIKKLFPHLTDKEQEIFIRILVSLTTFQDQLPQGTKTSPQIFNLLLKTLDQEIKVLLANSNLEDPKLTLFVDDGVISAKSLKNNNDQNDSEAIISELFKTKEAVKDIFQTAGLRLNEDKTQITTLNQSGDFTMITGIKITWENRLEIPESMEKRCQKFINDLHTAADLTLAGDFNKLLINIYDHQLLSTVKPLDLEDIIIHAETEVTDEILITLKRQIPRIDGTFNYIKNVLGYLPRELNKNYKSLQKSHPWLWEDPLPIRPAAIILDPETEENNYKLAA